VELSILSWGYPQSPSDDPVGDDWGSHMTAGKPPCITGSRGWFVEDHPRHRNWFCLWAQFTLENWDKPQNLGTTRVIHHQVGRSSSRFCGKMWIVYGLGSTTVAFLAIWLSNSFCLIWLVVSNMFFIPCHIWVVILPIDNGLIFFNNG
jgi:hypothetical protein